MGGKFQTSVYLLQSYDYYLMMGAWDTLPWGCCKFYDQILSICLCSNYTTNFDQQRHVCIRNSCADCFLTNFPSVSLARAHTLTHTITVIIRDLISQVVLCCGLCWVLPCTLWNSSLLLICWGACAFFGRQFSLSQVGPRLGKALCQVPRHCAIYILSLLGFDL